jgi:Uma2 family endonuclease
MGGVRTQLTFEQFEQLPDRPGKDELLEGELFELPPAKFKHNWSAHRLHKSLDIALEELHARGAASELGEAYHEMGYRLGRLTWLVPDVSITHASQAVGDYLQGAPALAVEILSDDNTPRKVARKVKAFLEHGAVQVWVLDCERREIRIHTSAGPETVHTGQFYPDLLPGIKIDLDQILGE